MTRTLNTRFIVVAVFAFLFIVALFASPGGPADEIVPPVDMASAAPAPMPVAAASPTSAAQSWYSQEEPTPPAITPSPAEGGNGGGNAVADVAPDQHGVAPPLPQGPDFPENR